MTSARHSADTAVVTARVERLTPIAVGGSRDLLEQPVREIRAIADEIGALVAAASRSERPDGPAERAQALRGRLDTLRFVTA